MPYLIKTENNKYCVYKEGDEAPITCHDTEKEATAHLTALNLNVEDAMKVSRMFSGANRQVITNVIEQLLGLLREQDKREAGDMQAEMEMVNESGDNGKTTNITILVKPEIEIGETEMEMEAETDSQETDMENMPNDAPNYHEALDPAFQCGTCEYGQNGYCEAYKFIYAKNMVCNSWDAIEPTMEDTPEMAMDSEMDMANMSMMKAMRVGGNRRLPIEKQTSWDGAGAKRRIFELAKFDSDKPDVALARDAFLIYDDSEPTLKGSYSLPFADVVNGKLVASTAGIRAAASRLPLTDAPKEVLDRAKAVLDNYRKEIFKSGVLYKKSVNLISQKEIADTSIAFSGSEMKTYIDNDKNLGYVEGLGVRFGNPIERDLTGDWFGADTNFGPHKGDGMTATLNHRLPLSTKGSTKSEQAFLRDLSKRQFHYPVQTKSTPYGILTSHVLDLADEYEKTVFSLVKQGKLKWSSGTASHLIDRDMSTGQIKSWPIIEFAYTPTPAEPRLPAITSLKSWSELLSNSIDASLETASTTVNGSIESLNTTDTNNLSIKNSNIPVEGNNMSDELTDLTVLVTNLATSVKTLADNQSAMQVRNDELLNVIKSAPAIKQTSGVEVVTDEGDRPFKTIGEQLLSVKEAAFNPASRDKRLDGVVTRRNNALKSLGLKATYSNEQVGSEGGFLLQDDFETAINRYIFEQGQVTSRCRRTPIGPGANALTYLMLDETSRAASNRYSLATQPQWMGEGATYSNTKPTFKRVRIELEKLGIIHRATEELLQDVVAFGSISMEIIGEAFNYEIQDAIVNGTGVGKPLGVLNSGALVSVAKEVGQAANSIVFANIVKMWARMQAKYRQNAVWYINQDIESQLYSLEFPVGTGGLPAFLPPGGLSSAPFGTLLGRPIMPIEQAQTLGTVGDIILADFGQYRLIDKGGLETASSIHVYFDTGEQAFRYTYRIGGAPNLESAITPANGTATQSAFVALATRA